MASFKMMPSSNSRNSDLSRRNSSSASSSSPSVRSNHLRRDPHPDLSRISFGNDLTIQDYAFASDSTAIDVDRSSVNGGRKSVDDVWKEIVSGEKKTILKEEVQEEDVMTLEDFLAKAAEMDVNDDDADEIDVKINLDYPMMLQQQQQQNPFQMNEGSISGGGMRRKRGGVMVEAMDKVAAQRQRRMIKNRESAARSREKKQAYQLELETLAAKLEEENAQLLKEIEEDTKERYKKLMKLLIPVDEKPKPSSSRCLSRTHSL